MAQNQVQRLDTALRIFDQELQKAAVRAAADDPQFKKIGKLYVSKVLKNAAFYPNVQKALAEYLNSFKQFHRLKITGDNSNVARARIFVKHFDAQQLDRHTPTEIKRDSEGIKRRMRTKNSSTQGWWRFFEFGSGDRDFGSSEYGFLSGGARGGRMVKLSEDSSLKPHPGVKQLRMFARAWRETRKIYGSEFKKLVEKHYNNPTSVVIEQAKRRTEARVGRITGQILNVQRRRKNAK